MSVSLSTFTDVSLIDSSASGGTIVLPRAGGIRYRVVVFKDRKGTFQNNPLTLNTLPGDIFEDGTTSKIFRDRFTQVWLYSDGSSVWHILSGTQLAAMTVSSITVSSIRGDGSLLTNINAISSLSLQSTLQGLGTLGYLSTASLLSTVVGLGSASYISTASLLSTTAGLQNLIQTSGAISTPNLISTVAGLGSAGYASTSFVGNAISTFSTALGPGGGINLTNLQSTVAGLGSATYLSSAQLLSTTSSYARAFQTLSASVSSLTASNVYASTLNVDNLIIGTGLGFINIGPLQATAISTIQVNTNALYANSNYFGTTSSQTALQFFGLTGSFSNTVIAEQSTGTGTQELLLYKVSSSADRIRMQTTGSIVFEPGVSARIWPAAPSNATPAMIIDTASNVGIGTAAPGSLLDVVGQGRFLTVSTQALWISSINGSIPLNPTQLISTVAGLGSASYVSTASLVSTTTSLQNQIQTGGFLSTATLTSTVAGLGSASYISTASLTSSLRGLGNLGYLSSINVPFISAFTVSTSRLNTSTLTFVDINTQAQQVLLVSSGVLTLNGNAIGGGSGGGSGLTASDFVVAGRLAADQNLTADSDTTIQFIKDYDPQNWYNATNYRFTPTIAGYYSVSFQVWFNPLVTNNNQNNIQIVKNGTDTYSITQLAQWSTTGASLNTTKIIYMNGTDYLRFQAYVGNTSNATAKALFGGNAYGSGTFFTAALLTNGSSGGNLISTTVGLGSIGYISTSQLVSTTFALQTQFQTAGYISSLNLISTVAGLGTAGYASTSFVGNAISTFSTALGPGDIYLPALVSSVAGLASASYISTSQLVSTVAGLSSSPAGFPSTVSTSYSIAFNTSSLLTSTINFINIPPSASNLWVAVGSDSTVNNRIKYSFNGINWFNSAGPGFSFEGLGVAYNGQMWVAVGVDASPNNTIKYSFNGINWFNSLGSGFSSYGFDVAWNGRMWVAVGQDSTQNNRIKYSFNGINWLNSASGGFTLFGLGIAWNGQMWVAVGNDSTQNNRIKYSYDGINWSNSFGTGFTIDGRGVAWNGRFWVVVGGDSTANGTIKYSFNGINWSNSVSGGFSSEGRGVAWNGSLWVATGVDSLQNNIIKYSTDGSNWSNSSNGSFSGYGNRVAWNGRFWMAAGADSTQNNKLKYSFDGINWSNSSGTGFTGDAWGIAYSSNTIPSYNQNNLSILPENIPIFLTSTNTIFTQPSSIIFNETLLVDRQWDRVGINCNIPQYSLDIAGSLNTSSFFINTSSFTTILTSTVAGIPSLPNLISTVAGLGSAGYASTSFVGNAISTFSTALGPGGGIQQSALTSSLVGLATLGYISTSQLVSTVAGIGTGGLASLPPFLSSFTLSTGSITTSSITGNQSIFQTLSSQSLTVSSFFTATRQMTPMFVVF